MGITDLIRPWHIILILVVAVLMFGPGKLAGLGKSLGEGLKGFKDSVSGAGDTKSVQTEVKPVATATPVATTEIAPEELADFKKYQALKSKAAEQS